MDARTLQALQSQASTRLVEASNRTAKLIEVPGYILLGIQVQNGTPFERQVKQIQILCDLLDLINEHLESLADGEPDDS